jgi:predicted hydrocarbon binding protein
MAKIENPLFLSIYSKMVDDILMSTANVEEANEKLRELGSQMAQQIYLTTEIVDKTKETITTREDVSKLIEVLFKVLFDKKPSDIDMESARGSVRVSDESCIWCQEVNLEGMRGFGYCEAFSGILQSILQFKGVDAKVFEESCKATGAEQCTWNVRLV